jgi:hypothetical protein
MTSGNTPQLPMQNMSLPTHCTDKNKQKQEAGEIRFLI